MKIIYLQFVTSEAPIYSGPANNKSLILVPRKGWEKPEKPGVNVFLPTHKIKLTNFKRWLKRWHKELPCKTGMLWVMFCLDIDNEKYGLFRIYHDSQKYEFEPISERKYLELKGWPEKCLPLEI